MVGLEERGGAGGGGGGEGRGERMIENRRYEGMMGGREGRMMGDGGERRGECLGE